MAKDTRRLSVGGVNTETLSSRTPLPVCGQHRLRLCTCLRVKRKSRTKKQDASIPAASIQDASIKEVSLCRSLSIFPGLCANLPLDTVESRSNSRPANLGRRAGRYCGQAIQAFETVSQPSKDKCGNTSIFFIGDEHMRYTGGLASPGLRRISDLDRASRQRWLRETQGCTTSGTSVCLRG